MHWKVLGHTLGSPPIVLDSAKVVPGVIEVVGGEGEASYGLVGKVGGRLCSNCVALVVLLLIF